MSRSSGIIFFFLILLFNSCTRDSKVETTDKDSDYLFKVLDPIKSGIDFRNDLTETDSLNILKYLYYYNGGGVAIGDINNDGLQDIFFTSNQEDNRLYMNEGNMTFRDISEEAGITGNSNWNTGVTMADVNADGLLDIYVVAVSGILGLEGRNELYINNGDNTFTEAAPKYGIDLQNFGTAAAFFDYDNDGDLDLYVLNHAVHTDDSFSPASIRERRTETSGDKLFEFENGKFIDVSAKAGIFGGPNAYGLGVATADFNADGFTDIYVSNDFHEDDYLYINQGDGTFEEEMKNKMTQVSRFSMGNDVGDINHDGFPDILSLDMLPEDETALKSSMGDEDINILNLRMQYGYHRQFSRNMLQLNNRGENFQEIALFSGVAATDWSWSPLFGDYDLDGELDIFISNGIVRRPNDLDYIKFISNKQISERPRNSEFLEKEAVNKMPEGRVNNYFFRGSKDLRFSDQSHKWVHAEPSFSNGSAYGDLDNDGDLDLVTNNLNAEATIYINTASENNTFLNLVFELSGENPFGIGTKVYSYHGGNMQYKQLFASKGFQSSSQPLLNFGFGKEKKVDSLLIIWPDGRQESLYEIKTNQLLKLKPNGSHKPQRPVSTKNLKKPIFTRVDSIPGFKYRHEENSYNDFDRQKLIPYRISNEMPSVAVGDLNNDGLDDLFIGNSRGVKAEIYLQTEDGLQKADLPFLEETKNAEIRGIKIADFNGDGINDLFYITGGGEFSGTFNALKDAFWINNAGLWKKVDLPEYFSDAGVISAGDLDKDGDLDIFIGGRAVAGDYGKIPRSYLLKNNNGNFEILSHPELEKAGMITDAVWEDLDKDGYPELIMVGEWMPPKIFKNNKGKLSRVKDKQLNQIAGLWRAIAPFDIDADGDSDLLLGNWGVNSKLQASVNSPLRMYYGDMDANGSTETILAKEQNGQYYTLAGLDELTGQLNFLKKKFPDYKGFAGKSLEQVFGDRLDKMSLLEITTLESGYLKNEDGTFKFIPFNKNLQFAPINTILVSQEFNDNENAAFLAGNYFGVIPYHGAFGAFPGAMIYSENDIRTAPETGIDFTGNPVSQLVNIKVNGVMYVIGFLNDDTPVIYKYDLPQ